jgi:hypothetical protein
MIQEQARGKEYPPRVISTVCRSSHTIYSQPKCYSVNQSGKMILYGEAVDFCVRVRIEEEELHL